MDIFEGIWKSCFSLGASIGQGNYLSVLIYHRVLDEKDPYRMETIDVKQFSTQMDWIRKHFVVLPLFEAVELLKQNKLPKRALSITFDDGYIDNLTVAAPLLKSKGLTASFYVSGNMFNAPGIWLDQMIEAVRATNLAKIEVGGKVFPLSQVEDKQAFLFFYENYFKSIPLHQAEKQLLELVDELSGGQSAAPVRLNMSENEVCQLHKMGMEIGSHGLNHKILSSIPVEEAENEIHKSKSIIESVIHSEVKGFAYPNGKYPGDFESHHREFVKQSGYSYALSTNYGCSDRNDDLYALKRFTPWKPSKIGFLSSMFLNYWYYQEAV